MADLCKGAARHGQALNSGEPIKTLLAPKRFAEIVRPLDGLDPLGILVAELGRGSQPQRITEWIGKNVAGIFGGENGLRMQRGRHIDALGVVVGADEVDIFGGEVGTDTLKKVAQVRSGPLSDVITSLQ